MSHAGSGGTGAGGTGAGGTGAGGTVWWLAAALADVPKADGWLAGAERERLAGFHLEARRQGWRLRRWAAKQALLLVPGGPGAEMAELEVGNRPDGSPVARHKGEDVPVAMTLTDRAGWAVCALGPPQTALGCDMELVEPRTDAFVRDYFTDGEQRMVAGAPERQRAANLVWSAKESALKVLHEGLRRPTRSVEVRLDPAADPRREPGGWAPLRVGLVEGGEVQGWWRLLGPFVVTLAAAGPTPPPVALADMPPGW